MKPVQALSFLKNKSVLYAEDDTITRMYFLKTLGLFFNNVHVAENGEQAYRLYKENRPDILICDIKMPKCDGISLVRSIRRENYQLPIILMTSFTERDLLIDAANLSIDGYLVKPIMLEQLTQTLSNAFKRMSGSTSTYKLSDDVFLNIENCILSCNGISVPLGIKEMELMCLLVANNSKIVSKEEITHTLWPLEFVHDSTLKMTVARLRKKIGIDIITSVRGFGYRIDLPSI